MTKNNFEVPDLVFERDGNTLVATPPEGYAAKIEDGKVVVYPIDPVYTNGDVLVYRQDPKDGDYRILLFKAFTGSNATGLDIYCGVTSGGSFFGERANYGYKTNPITFADEEQRALLFSAMRLNGMVWDDENGTVRKVFSPVDGSLVVFPDMYGNVHYAIYKAEGSNEDEMATYLLYDSDYGAFVYDEAIPRPSAESMREGTEEDMAIVQDLLYKEGKQWYADKQAVEECERELVNGEVYYTPLYQFLSFSTQAVEWTGSEDDEQRMASRMCFLSEAACMMMCGRLNEALSPFVTVTSEK